MKKKGFTLIELLAVIVILAIIAVIVIPVVGRIVEDAKVQTAIQSVNGYVDAANNAAAISLISNRGIDIDSDNYTLETGNTDSLIERIEVKGSKPTYTYIEYSVVDKTVSIGHFCMNGYSIDYNSNSGTTKSNADYCGDGNSENTTVLAYLIGIKKGEKVSLLLEDMDGASYSSSDTSIATVDTSGKITGVNYGETTVMATKDSKSLVIKVKVINPYENMYVENTLNGAYPVISDNLIPVTISDSGVVKKADISTKWYSYADKVWANAVILKDNTVEYLDEETIPESNIDSYFVWIPRYKYKLFDMGNYTSYSGTSKPATSNAKTIDIVFESKDADPSNGNAVGEYLTHPAFTSFDVNGIWVGKFEVSGSTSDLDVKPNVTSLRNTTVGNFFTSMYNYNRNLDSHMMKNTEWGAVAYLSLSQYGINGEVRINNNSQFVTGCAATVANTSNVGVSQTNHTEGYYDGCENAYNTSIGYLASTTGNISGIYDMSGGAWEYVAGYINGNVGNSGLTPSNYDTKYFDVYSSSSSINSYNYRILGDATDEMGPFYYYKDSDNGQRYHNNWFADVSYFVESSYPWFIRGGDYSHGVLAGQLYFDRDTGAAYSYSSARLVLAPQ